MNYLFTAAGKGTRFTKNGINIPKPLIKVFGKELLLWSLDSFKYIENDFIYIITQKKDQIKYLISQKLKEMYKQVQFIWVEIEETTNGQLITAMKAIEKCNISGKIIIHNCDTYHNAKDINYLSLLNNGCFGLIPCFKTAGDHWSFVKTYQNSNKAILVKEKERISSNCSVGTYIFNDAELLYKLAKEYIKLNKNNSEFYIAPFYQFAIDNNYDVKICEAYDVKVYGTPTELLKTFKINRDDFLIENKLEL
tara:strand:+ start:719 stop:1471 length:753 start_codon:yes stop_codon:yes gene_type:complete